MPCGLSRDAQTLWKKPIPIVVNGRTITPLHWYQRQEIGPARHCSSCDSEWVGETDCPHCGGEAF